VAHADQAKVNVNFWLTPEDANLDKSNGGLLIYKQEPPEDWTFESYNHDSRKDAIHKFLAESRAGVVEVPYKTNRCVVFNSKLLHETAKFNFKPGYRNRRINVTLLFGRSTEPDDGSAKRHPGTTAL
jgi:hypothetical protein